MTQSCLISTTPFASAIQACGRACSQPLAVYVTCVCFLLVGVCYIVHERAARKVAEYEADVLGARDLEVAVVEAVEDLAEHGRALVACARRT